MPLSMPSSRIELDKVEESESFFDNQSSFLAWNFNSYFSSDEGAFRNGAKSEITDLDLRLTGFLKPLNIQLDLRNTYRTGEDFNYVKPYELYVPFEIGETHAQVGRVLKPWSWADSYWEQGVWQPRFMDDKLLTEAAGLTGLFLEKDWGSSEGMFWASPVNIPEMGPHYSIEEGQFTAASPWFNTPPEYVNISGVTTRVEYSVNEPQLENFIFRPGAGVNLKTTNPWFANMSYAYKPMPQIMLGFPYFLALGEVPDSSALNIEVNARLLYHHVATLESVHQTSQGVLSSALTFEAPERDETPSNWITQEVKNAVVASVKLERPLFLGVTDMGWLKVWGGDLPDEGEFAPAGTVFERRYQYLHAFRAGFTSSKIQVGSSLLGFRTGFIYDIEQAGVTWKNEVTLQPNSNFIMHVRADIIGLTGEEEKVEDSFIRAYRTNDRIQGGVRYVF